MHLVLAPYSHMNRNSGYLPKLSSGIVSDVVLDRHLDIITLSTTK